MSDRIQMSDARPSQPQGLAYNDVMPPPRGGNPVEPHGPISPPIEPPGRPPTPGSSANSDASASAAASSYGSISNRQVFLNATPYSPGLAGGGECTKSKSGGANILGLVGISTGESGPDMACIEKRQEVIKHQTVCNSAVNDAMVAGSMMDKALLAGREYNTNPAARPVLEMAGAVATQFAGSSLKQAGACDDIAKVYTGNERTPQLPSLQIDQSDLERTAPKPVEAPRPVPVVAAPVEQARVIVHHKLEHHVTPKAPHKDVDCDKPKK